MNRFWWKFIWMLTLWRSKFLWNDLWPQRSLKITKGQFHVYFNLNLRSYGQLFVLVSIVPQMVITLNLFLLFFGFCNINIVITISIILKLLKATARKNDNHIWDTNQKRKQRTEIKNEAKKIKNCHFIGSNSET